MEINHNEPIQVCSHDFEDKLVIDGVLYNVTLGRKAYDDITCGPDNIRLIPNTWYNRLGWYKLIGLFKRVKHG